MSSLHSVVAVALFSIGVAVYLAVSGAPTCVQAVTIATDCALLAVATYFAFARALRPVQRMGGCVVGIGVVSVITTWALSKVIAVLNPLDATSFFAGIGASLVQAVVFVSLVWLVTRIIEHLRAIKSGVRSKVES
jgi:hypothetical protein